MNILFCDDVNEEVLEIFREKNIQVDQIDPDDHKQIEAIIEHYDGIIINESVSLNEELLSKGKKIKVIGLNGVSTENIDVDYATLKGIVIIHASKSNTTAMAEYTMALMLSLARKVGFDQSDHIGFELKGKTLGIIGLGNVGSQVAKRAKAFDMRVICYDPKVNRARASLYDVEMMDLVDLFILSDIITIHSPLNKMTKQLINQDTLALMKKGVRIINTSSRAIINENDLKEFIDNGIVSAVSLDYAEGDVDNVFEEYKNVFVSKNLSAATEEAKWGIAKEVFTETVAVLEHGISKNAINVPVIKEELIAFYRPFQRLGDICGKFLAQTITGNIQEITLKYVGDIANHDIKPLNQRILLNIFEHNVTENINYVNVYRWARNKGISIQAEKDTYFTDYQNMISVTVVTDQGVKQISGNIFSNGEIRIVKLDDIETDTKPEKHIVIVPHDDKPGMIGFVGGVLGEFGINISSMTVSKNKAEGNALMLMSVDRDLSTEEIRTIEDSDGIYNVQYVCL